MYHVSTVTGTFKCTLTDPNISCPGALAPLGYPWVYGGREVTPEPRFRGLVLDHQDLNELEPKSRLEGQVSKGCADQ